MIIIIIISVLTCLTTLGLIVLEVSEAWTSFRLCVLAEKERFQSRLECTDCSACLTVCGRAFQALGAASEKRHAAVSRLALLIDSRSWSDERRQRESARRNVVCE
jgi:hypothetical protein